MAESFPHVEKHRDVLWKIIHIMHRLSLNLKFNAVIHKDFPSGFTFHSQLMLDIFHNLFYALILF